MPPAAASSRDASPHPRPQPYRTSSASSNSSPVLHKANIISNLSRSASGLRRTPSQASSVASAPSPGRAGDESPGLHHHPHPYHHDSSGNHPLSRRGSARRPLPEDLLAGEDLAAAGDLLSLDPALRNLTAGTARHDHIHAPQPRRLDMAHSERMYSTPTGSPSPGPGGGGHYTGGAPSPSGTPTPGGGNESSQSAASKRREANRLAAARFRTRKKDQVTELESRVAALEADNANLKAEVDVWRSGRDGREWVRMRSSIVGQSQQGQGQAGGGGGTDRGGRDQGGARYSSDEKPEIYDTSNLGRRHDSDEIIPPGGRSGALSDLLDEDPNNPSAAGKKRRKVGVPAGSEGRGDILSSSSGGGGHHPAGPLSTSSNGSSGGGGGGYGAEEENRRLIEQMRRYETVMEGMRAEMREYRDRLGMQAGGGGGRRRSRGGDDDDDRPYMQHSSSSYSLEPDYASSSSSLPGMMHHHHPHQLPPPLNTNLSSSSRMGIGMSREASNLSINLPPLSPALRITSPTGGYPGMQGGGGGSPGGGGGGGMMATLADAAAASSGVRSTGSRPPSPMRSLSSSPTSVTGSGVGGGGGHLRNLAALAAATSAVNPAPTGGSSNTRPGAPPIDRSRSWTSYPGHAGSPGPESGPSGGAQQSAGAARLSLLASGRDSPVSAERGTAMDDDEDDSGGGAKKVLQDEPMEYFDRRMGSGLKHSWEEPVRDRERDGRDGRDVRMRSETRSPEPGDGDMKVSVEEVR